MPTPSTRSGRAAPPFRRASASLLAAALLAGSVAACTGDDKPEDEAEPTSTPPPPVTVAVDLNRVAGGLKPDERTRISKKVEVLLQDYVDAALLGTGAPNAALAHFTKGAAKAAQPDLDLLTASGLGDVQSITAKKLRAKLSVLAPDGKPAGATARILFALAVDGSRVTYKGRLMLVPDEGEWKILGYDVRRNDKRADLGVGTSEEDS